MLEFNGVNDSIFQAYNANGDLFMQYLADYGSFEDFPYQFVINNLEQHYPKFKMLMKQSATFNL